MFGFKARQLFKRPCQQCETRRFLMEAFRKHFVDKHTGFGIVFENVFSTVLVIVFNISSYRIESFIIPDQRLPRKLEDFQWKYIRFWPKTSTTHHSSLASISKAPEGPGESEESEEESFPLY